MIDLTSFYQELELDNTENVLLFILLFVLFLFLLLIVYFYLV